MHVPTRAPTPIPPSVAPTPAPTFAPHNASHASSTKALGRLRAGTSAIASVPNTTASNSAIAKVVIAGVSAAVLLLGVSRARKRRVTDRGYLRIDGSQRTTALGLLCPCFATESMDTATEVERIFDEPPGADDEGSDEMHVM